MAGKLYFPSVTVYRSFECIKTFALSSKCATFNVLCPTKKIGMDFTSPIWKKLDKFLKASQKTPKISDMWQAHKSHRWQCLERWIPLHSKSNKLTRG